MNMNALDLNLIRVLDALMSERSVTRAGERIGLSQPAVSAALSRLRHVFNDSLFIRQGHDMVPTPLALDLGERVRMTLAAVEEMVRSVRVFEPATLNRTFTLMGADFFSMMLMPHLSRQVRQMAPQVRLRLLDSARGDVSRLLQENAVDMALEGPLKEAEWVASEPLFRSPFKIVAAPDNPALAGLAEDAPLPLDIYLSLSHALRSIDGSMSGLVDEALFSRQLARRVVLALPHFHSVAQAVSMSDLIAALPAQLVATLRHQIGLAVFEPPFPVPVPDVRLYWHSRYSKDPAHAWMRDLIQQCVKDLGFQAGD